MALHTNHPRELTPAARAAIARLTGAGIPVVSQSVLLRGVNDDADTLEALMRALCRVRVKPYYLHHGDLAPGTAHFRVPLADGQALMAELRRRLSGSHCQPTCSIFPARTARFRWDPATSRATSDRRVSRHGRARAASTLYDDACALRHLLAAPRDR